jgi:hypothetical protein
MVETDLIDMDLVLKEHFHVDSLVMCLQKSFKNAFVMKGAYFNVFCDATETTNGFSLMVIKKNTVWRQSFLTCRPIDVFLQYYKDMSSRSYLLL